jgi:hypothetical protein
MGRMPKMAAPLSGPSAGSAIPIGATPDSLSGAAFRASSPRASLHPLSTSQRTHLGRTWEKPSELGGHDPLPHGAIFTGHDFYRA